VTLKTSQEPVKVIKSNTIPIVWIWFPITVLW